MSFFGACKGFSEWLTMTCRNRRWAARGTHPTGVWKYSKLREKRRTPGAFGMLARRGPARYIHLGFFECAAPPLQRLSRAAAPDESGPASSGVRPNVSAVALT